MKLRFKLLLAESPLLLALVVIGTLAISMAASMSARTEAILKDNFRSILAAQTMHAAFERMQLSLLEYQLGDSDNVVMMVRAEAERFDRELRIQENNITEQGEAAITRRLREAFTQFAGACETLVSRPLGREWGEAYRRTAAQSGAEVRRTLDEILALNQAAVAHKGAEAQRAAANLRLSLLWTFLACLVLGVFASVRLTRRLLVPLQDLMQAARSLGERDFSARAPVIGGDEIAQLAREFNTMADRLNAFQRSTLGELLHAQQSAQAVIDSLSDPVLVFDAEGRLANFNAATQDTFRIPAEAIDVVKLLPPAILEVVEKLSHHVLSGRGAYAPRGFEESIRIETSDAERYLLPRAAPVLDDAGSVVGAALLLQDITRLRRFDELQTNMVATVAHEIRTPLTSLHMAIHLCLDGTVGDLTEKQKDLLYAARGDCERLQTMVSDLLALSRTESGVIAIQPRPVEASRLIENAEMAHASEASLRKVQLVVERPPPGELVGADLERIALTFDNLISNAIRHTPEGGTITVRALPSTDAVRFEVTDTGPGIAPQFHHRVFDKFFRVPGLEGGGAGIGLYLAREVVQAHGGQIGVEGTVGKGSTFWFTLPRTPAD